MWPIAVLAGAACGVAGALTTGAACAVAVAAASLAGAAVRRPRQICLLLTVAAVAALRGASARDGALAPPLGAWLETHAPDGRMDESVLVRGRLAGDAARTPSGVRLLVDVDDVRENGEWRRAPGRVQALVAGALAESHVEEWRDGRAVVAPIALRQPQTLRNPGAARPEWDALRRPFHLVGSIKSAALVTVGRGSGWREACAAVRVFTRNAIDRHVGRHSLQSAAVVTAILIGDRVGIDPAIEARLQRAGTYHTIAISGGNVALVAALCAALSRLFWRSAPGSIAITLVAVALYGLIVGSQPSVNRAVIAAAVMLALWAAGLTAAPIRIVGAAGMVLVLADPLVILSVGAWLSFGATIAIVLGAGRLAGRIRSVATSSTWAASGVVRRWRVLSVLWRAAVVLLAATIAAELALLPIGAAVFGRVSVAGLVLNFVAIPAMAIAQMAGFATVASAAWWPWAADVCGLVAHGAAAALLRSSVLVDRWEWLSWRVPPAGAWWIALYYLCLSAVLVIRDSRRRVVALVGAIVCAIVLMTAPGTTRAAPRAGWLRVSMLDVGQGDAIAVQFPGGRTLLVDAGGAGSFDIGSRVITPALWALGIRQLDWLLVTHPDLDHIGGAASLVADMNPREIWEGVDVPPNHERAVLHDFAVAHSRPWRRLRDGESMELGGVTVEVRHPPPPEWERQRTRNDDSVVLKIAFGAVEFWLTGDAGVEFEQRSAVREGRLPLRVLKVGHHGSRSSSSPAFVNDLQPDVALISAGRANLFGHPAPDVVARLLAAHARVFRTDRDGAVIVETNGERIEVMTVSADRWTVSLARTRS